MTPRSRLADALATAFLHGEWTADQMNDRASELLGRRWSWLERLARRVAKMTWRTVRPKHSELAEFIRCDRGFLRADERYELHISNWLVGQDVMSPATAASSWPLPPICTSRELAEWLEISLRELDWFADYRQLGFKRHRERRAHYWYRPVSKRFGQVRLIEAPKARLKAIQRKILTGILDLIPPHPASQAFRRGTSIRTFAGPHVGQTVVLKLDLRDFFPSISRARVEAVFFTAGYPEPVALLLAGLCTTATPFEIWDQGEIGVQRTGDDVRRRYARRHLPQGSPSSPALANLCAYRLDCRLAGLAQAAGAVYTRYADDLAFSGDEEFRRQAKRFQIHASAVAMDEGFSVHHRKTRLMNHSARQQIAGIVINEHLNVRRRDYDQLKAILTNCIRLGPAGQNRQAHGDFRRHLEGRIAHVRLLNPAKGKKLHDLFQRIPW